MAPKTSNFDYALDPELVAQTPADRRDESRLMVLRRSNGAIEHRVFAELPALLGEGDLLVVNNTRVVPAKFACRRTTGGRIEGLFCLEVARGTWRVLLRGASRCRAGEQLDLERCEEGVRVILRENLGKGLWVVRIEPEASAEEILGRAGATPLPPYIRREGLSQDAEDQQRYQTVYAARAGAVAAPTAGLHFTNALLEALAAKGVQTAPVTLHVGVGTFAPVKSDDPAEHEMHSEWYDLSPETASALNVAKRDGRRIVAVGTTSVRVLETVAAGRVGADEPFAPATGWTDIFIRPPAEFNAIDALITNFHLPKSTLLMLVAAFCDPGGTAGVETMLAAYAEATRLRYRFFSYGDAMLIE